MHPPVDILEQPIYLDKQQADFSEIAHKLSLLPILGDQPGVMILEPDLLEVRPPDEAGFQIRQPRGFPGQSRRLAAQICIMGRDLGDDQFIELILLL